MKRYGGIDPHSNNCAFSLIDYDGNVVIKKRIVNNLTKITALLDPYKEALSGLWLNQNIIGTGNGVLSAPPRPRLPPIYASG